ncbi:DUF2188 domain-containing protein [Leifsonia xyli]|uniref:DUF2188 domain-containing protein n=1 Tax=Leifsonia xyli TaxID=1575 RepID=UPI0009EF2611
MAVPSFTSRFRRRCWLPTAGRTRFEGGEQLGDTFDTEEDAVADGREEAQSRGAEHTIRNSDGTIGEKNSHGHDQRNIPG